jgi:hypothetical protein
MLALYAGGTRPSRIAARMSCATLPALFAFRREFC